MLHILHIYICKVHAQMIGRKMAPQSPHPSLQNRDYVTFHGEELRLHGQHRWT